MADPFQAPVTNVEAAVSALEQAIPLLITPSRHGEGIAFVVQAAEALGELGFDPNFKQLSTVMKILANGGSLVLQTVTFQGFIVDLLEKMTKLLGDVQNSGNYEAFDVLTLLQIGQFLTRLAGRITNRYKIQVMFEPEYEAKSLRAFMVLKELSTVVRYLNIAPDISENQAANLDNGLEIDCLSQENPDELHRIAGSVLEVQNVQIFRETRALPVNMLDPPSYPNSFDKKIADYINR